MKKIAIYVFRGDSMCFVHVMLNALDMKEKGYDVKVIIEGEAVKLIQSQAENPLFIKMKPLVDCVCRACSSVMGVLEYNEKSGLPLCGDMYGHPPMSKYIDEGYSIITF